MRRVGVYPGTFNPLTVAHLAIASAAHDELALERVDLVVSRSPLAKDVAEHPCLDHRLEVLHRAAETRPWFGVVVTEARLLADIAQGYDVLVLGADKWAQLLDPAFYGGSDRSRDEVLARLPQVALAPRPPHAVPDGHVVLPVDASVRDVSATEARGGRRSWMAPEALAFDDETGAWSDPERYASWCRGAGRQWRNAPPVGEDVPHGRLDRRRHP